MYPIAIGPLIIVLPFSAKYQMFCSAQLFHPSHLSSYAHIWLRNFSPCNNILRICPGVPIGLETSLYYLSARICNLPRCQVKSCLTRKFFAARNPFIFLFHQNGSSPSPSSMLFATFFSSEFPPFSLLESQNWASFAISSVT